MRRSAFSVSLKAALAVTAVALFASGASASSETVLYAFSGGADGGTPNGTPIADGSGNLYGTTLYGGQYGYGSVFQLAPPAAPGKTWTETVLYSFLGGLDGSGPSPGLVADSLGNLYGTAPGGGRFGTGVAYRLSPPRKHGGAWTQTVLFAFDHRRGDGNPGFLIFDGAGNLYGSSGNAGSARRGNVFELTPGARGSAWTENVLYAFGPCSLCGGPSNGLTFDRNGALYGLTTAQIVGSPDSAFQLTPPASKGDAWTYSDLHDFLGGQGDGDIPVDSPVFDSDGNIYGTTESGGIGQCQGGGCGTVFELSPPAHHGGAWKETLLHVFTGGGDGGAPLSTLIIDAAGNLYGTTVDGGAHLNGTAFELVRGGGSWTERVLHSFAAGRDGQYPQSGMAFGKGGALYGTTPYGGAIPRGKCAPHGCGTVYRIVP